MNKLKFVCGILSVTIFVSCGDVNLGMRSQKYSMLAIGDTTNIYCYHVAWALSSEAYFISLNKDVCMGFDSTKDVCFPGRPAIYYELKADSLHIYSNFMPLLPEKFPLKLKLTPLNILGVNEYEKKFKNGAIKRIMFDTVLVNIPCKAVPYLTANNMKFVPK